MNFPMLRQKKEEVGGHAQIASLEALAAILGRRSQCWIYVHVVCRPTGREARAYLDHSVCERGDWETARNMLAVLGRQSATLEPSVPEAFRFHLIAGHGGYPLVGTPEQIVEVLPPMEQAGQRAPAS